MRHNSLRKELVRDFFAALDSTLSTVESDDNQCPECERDLNPDATRCHDCNPYEVVSNE